MTSAEPARGRRLLRAPARVRGRRWTLRARLLLVLVALLAVVCAAVGWVTVVALQRFLIGRLDSQLSSAGGRSANAGSQAGQNPQGDGNHDETGAQFLLTPGQSAGTLGARIKAGSVNAVAVLGDDGQLQTLTPSQVPALSSVRPGAAPRTLELGALGDYRVAGIQTGDGDTLITGLPLHDVERTVHQLVAVELAVAAAGIVVATGAGALVITRTLRPLRRVAHTAARVSTLPLAQGDVGIEERIDAHDVDSRTEVGQVAGSVNRLLDHVDAALSARQESEMKVRRFVADASHELRTPLTAIRGYAELTRPMRAEAPPQLGYALERVESEAERMSGMVEDLLMLARLDAGRELAQDPVDLTHLLLDVVSDAVASSPDHHYDVMLPDDPVEVRGDAGSLHQVFANLLANARVHTPPGTKVTLTLSLAGSAAVVDVSDDGPGIPAEILPTVFERFARASASRSRDSGSTGLGLAIVRAIVESHRGTVTVRTEPGRTTFTVRLPVQVADGRAAG